MNSPSSTAGVVPFSDVAAALPSSTALFVTVSLETLRTGLGYGEVIGSRASGTLLSASEVRRLAADAHIIPVILGTKGEPVDVGAPKRLFTPAQRRFLWLRDRGCTYPRCDAPPAWTRAHHVRWWFDDGVTDVSNGALLCQRHHSHVHRAALWADVSATPDENGRYVDWDTNRGSYHRHFAENGIDVPSLRHRPQIGSPRRSRE